MQLRLSSRWPGLEIQTGPVLIAVWLAGLAALVFGSSLGWLAGEWRDNPYYEHGPLVPLVSLALAAWILARLRREPSPGSALGPVLVCAGLLLRLVAALSGSELFGAIGLVVALAGFAAWWLGRPGLLALAFPIAYLLFAVPFPFMDDLGFYFQRFSTATTTQLVKLAGIPATYQGAEISLARSSFIVGIQCSGLYSMMSLTALGILFARLFDLGSWRRSLLFVAAIPVIAMLSNIFRLSSILAIAHWQSVELAIDYYHNLAGIVFWFVAMGLLFIAGKGLEWRPAAAGS